ncbi:MAG: beta-ketoacyl synthase N-terminal-like domain-containing protein, partial [Alphaproteobacteria bacterium]
MLDAGYFGQLLMERQAEFGLGVCPIGGMRFERVRDSMLLEDEAVFLHSFTCGTVSNDIPEGRKKLTEQTEGTASETLGLNAATDPVAIIGISGRYPGARSLDIYWNNLKSGVSSIAAFPVERRNLLGKSFCRDLPPGGYLDQVDSFDSLLFGISPVEARSLDPQERLLLEEVWAAIEDAGYTAKGLAEPHRRIGVYAGAMWNDYQSVGVESWRASGKAEEFSHHASLANRISYVFDFTGPSIAVNTSCSAGITALHLACESIRRGECDAAIAGGVNLLTHPYHAQLLADLGLLSNDGDARPLSAQASGWAPGEGAGAVVLKSLRQAEQDGDHIYAVIKSSYAGHSGKSSRYGAPNSRRQAEHLRQLLANAGLTPGDISYIEAGAPGASIADAAEMNAVNDVFKEAPRSTPCFIGTVKGNIGHLESASGLSQLTKTVLQLRHEMLAPAINSEPRNPLIRMDEKALSVVTQPTPWPQQ